VDELPLEAAALAAVVTKDEVAAVMKETVLALAPLRYPSDARVEISVSTAVQVSTLLVEVTSKGEKVEYSDDVSVSSSWLDLSLMAASCNRAPHICDRAESLAESIVEDKEQSTPP
jgi:hypothetical protein